MGYHFQLKHASVVGYLTNPTDSRPPRVRVFDLGEFASSIAMNNDGDTAYLISSRPEWRTAVLKAAQEASATIGGWSHYREFATDDDVTRVLAPLKRLLSDHELFALGVCEKYDDALYSFLREAAYASGGFALFLMPDRWSESTRLQILDPFPGIALAAEHPESWPGVLFWSRTGAARFASLREARELYARELYPLFRGQDANTSRRLDEVLTTRASAQSSKRILHLSDLHFGTETAARRSGLLAAHLSQLDAFDTVVITGDLMENPREQDALAFRNFKNQLRLLTRKEPILIPGNHDQRWQGIVGRNLKQIAELEWRRIEVDENIKTIFICFDSSRDVGPAGLARGKIGNAQLIDLGTELETKSAMRHDLHDYLRVALVHHHPFSFETERETIIQRGLGLLGLSDEIFMQMDDAEGFLRWCAGRRVDLILHGHKHRPRYVHRSLKAPSGDQCDIAAVGCGASLGGPEGGRLAYNVVTWHPSSQRWAASFFADAGDGSGFHREYICIERISPPSTDSYHNSRDNPFAGF